MSCINFKVTKKNNRWRENIGKITQKDNEMTFFGIDTESNVNTLLQNNITLLDWIRKSKGFPYFVGRWINGHDPLTKDEIDYIKSIGSNVIPIIRPEDSLSYDSLSEKTVSILKELNFEKGTVVFLTIGSNDMPSECLIAFAKGIIDKGYIPGFYADTDSYYEFDHQFSIAYQDDETTMKKCKIWALSPEMEEFFETRTSHNPQPDFWGPFAPSCLSKEQISFWQYGKKTHPIKSYGGERVDFNLNLSNDPSLFFDICNVDVLDYDFYEVDNKQVFEATVTNHEKTEKVSLKCDFTTAASDSIFFNNKTYSKNIDSEHKILEYVVCSSNDPWEPQYIIEDGMVLVKLSFISNISSCVFKLRLLLPLIEFEVLNKIITQSPVFNDEEEIRKLGKQETWAIPFYKENTIEDNVIIDDESNDSISNVNNYIYKSKENIFESQIISPMLMRTSIRGDKYDIFDYLPQSAVKKTGTKFCTIKDVNGTPSKAYYVDTIYQDNIYYSVIAIWDLIPVLDYAANDLTKRVVSFEFKRAYNAFAYYYPTPNEISVVYTDDNSAYVLTTNTQISMVLTGCHSAYIKKCLFENNLGGSESANYAWIVDTVLGLFDDTYSYISDAFNILSETFNTVSNAYYNKATKEYELSSNGNLVTKAIGSTYKAALYKKYSLLKMRATLNNVTVYNTSRVFCQVQTSATRISGSNRTIYFGGSIPLK